MNEHDSGRAAGMLETLGYRRAAREADADLVLLNTCAVRENADNKLYGTLGHLKGVKQRRQDEGEDLKIVVGGCLAQKDGAVVAEKAPRVDVVYGTHNLPNLPALLAQADSAEVPVVELIEQLTAPTGFVDEVMTVPVELVVRSTTCAVRPVPRRSTEAPSG